MTSRSSWMLGVGAAREIRASIAIVERESAGMAEAARWHAFRAFCQLARHSAENVYHKHVHVLASSGENPTAFSREKGNVQ